METELLDIYDENNQPLGMTKSRAEVHQRGYWHRTVHVYLIDVMGKYLVHLRSPKKDDHPNCWDTRFGGHVTAGKDYLQTAIEELNQEVGLTMQESDLIPGEVYTYDGTSNKEFSKVYYYCYVSSDNLLKFNDGEVVEVKWMTPDEIINSMTITPEQWAGGVKNFQTINTFYQNVNG